MNFIKTKKLKNDFLKIFAFSFSLLFYSCEYYSYGLDEFFYRNNTVNNRVETLLELENNDFGTEYKILVITDVHFGGENHGNNKDRPEEDFFAELKKICKTQDETPKICICLGDIAEHGIESEFQDFVKKLSGRLQDDFNIKTYNVVGNHDLYNSGFSHYKKLIYPYTSFYRFETPNLSYYFLDSASCSLSNKQFTKLQRRFAYDKKSKIVFMHVPLYADDLFYFKMQNTEERNKIISLFAKNSVIATIDGHTHKEITSELSNFTEYNLPGYLQCRVFTILTINETNKTITKKCIYF